MYYAGLDPYTQSQVTHHHEEERQAGVTHVSSRPVPASWLRKLGRQLRHLSRH